jgi:hypothetical protein
MLKGAPPPAGRRPPALMHRHSAAADLRSMISWGEKCERSSCSDMRCDAAGGARAARASRRSCCWPPQPRGQQGHWTLDTGGRVVGASTRRPSGLGHVLRLRATLGAQRVLALAGVPGAPAACQAGRCRAGEMAAHERCCLSGVRWWAAVADRCGWPCAPTSTQRTRTQWDATYFIGQPSYNTTLSGPIISSDRRADGTLLALAHRSASLRPVLRAATCKR